MSIQAIAWVLETSRSELADRLVLIAIANHCDAHFCCWPSIDMIAAEARVSRATVFRSVKQLVLLGELEVSPGGRGKGRRSSYRVAHYQGSQDDTVNLDSTVSSTHRKGVTGATHKPLGTVTTCAASANVPQTWVPEGSLQQLSEEEKRKGKERLRELPLRERDSG